MVHANFRAISEVVLNVSETTLTKMKRISVKRWGRSFRSRKMQYKGECNIQRRSWINIAKELEIYKLFPRSMRKFSNFPILKLLNSIYPNWSSLGLEIDRFSRVLLGKIARWSNHLTIRRIKSQTKKKKNFTSFSHRSSTQRDV